MRAIWLASALAILKMRMFWLPLVEPSRSLTICSMSAIDSRGARTMMVLVRTSGVSEIDWRVAAEISISAPSPPGWPSIWRRYLSTVACWPARPASDAPESTDWMRPTVSCTFAPLSAMYLISTTVCGLAPSSCAIRRRMAAMSASGPLATIALRRTSGLACTMVAPRRRFSSATYISSSMRAMSVAAVLASTITSNGFSASWLSAALASRSTRPFTTSKFSSLAATTSEFDATSGTIDTASDGVSEVPSEFARSRMSCWMRGAMVSARAAASGRTCTPMAEFAGISSSLATISFTSAPSSGPPATSRLEVRGSAMTSGFTRLATSGESSA